MSFRRKSPGCSSSLRSGTKPFLNGQTLVSSGLSELDAALGGGLLLRTLNVVEAFVPGSDDCSSNVDLSSGTSESLAIDLLRYFVAEGVVDGKQRVAVVAPDATAFVNEQLPLELSLAQRHVKQQLADKNKDDESLTIAWQYGKYRQKQQNRKQRFCHSYDLSKMMHREMVAANEPVAIDPLSWTTETDVGDAYERIYLAIQELVQLQRKDGGGQVLRVGVLGLGSSLLGPADAAHTTALFGFFRKLRALLAHSTGAVCLVLLSSDAQIAFPAAFVNELRHLSDSVLTLNAFAGTRDLLPGELQEFQGSLTLRKLPRVYALACHAPSNTRFGIKRDRRKLKVEKFHLPPEGSRSSNNNSSRSGGTTSSSGGTCTDLLAF
ncbi:elongator complex protein, putative [Phytophthora infestans T30-4]|uniref:Elongator complex protein 4 n=2 Tax=Phytophthora infestans TaxID=4787 RepID=D0MZ39_PHYIT|nr:elongator complex protein, putative [Phytophthora infestans T30-4]EEY66437.1 elongator complex protein, putative [Phytophthora infestans T30-4]KAF4035786.1 PAXNEB domain-containing protein [Phytophthora infestans]KAF4145083.1 PAXNEB domain-containing protein [Phytophthora infestans]|eukprot:XP_002907036.1 elongator complex protein, putative [Phytophthora infestans T30-4]